MRTMDTMCASHQKYRPPRPLSAASFYQPDMYARPSTLRAQSEYRFAGGGSTIGARSRGGGGMGGGMMGGGMGGGGSRSAGSRRARLCSAALAAAALLAAIAVLAVAALAFYMGALRQDNADPIISFECSMRVTRGDVYGGAAGSPAWRERARRYSAALRAVYSADPAASPAGRAASPPLRAAFAGVHVTGFGDHRLDVYFILYLDRRKIPSSISNIEEILKDILVQDLQSKKPAFGHIKIDPASIVIKRDLEHTYHSESYVKQAINESMTISNMTNLSQTISKDKGGTRMGVIRKTTIKPNVFNKKRVATSNGDEPDIDTENLPVIQGSFQITKTDADITENKPNEGQTRVVEKVTSRITTTHKAATITTPFTTTLRPKPFTMKSTLKVKTRPEAPTTKKIEIFNKQYTSTSTTPRIFTTPSSTTSSSTTNQVSQLLLDLLTQENHEKDLPKIDTLFTVPHVIDEEPWKPITKPSSIYTSSSKPPDSVNMFAPNNSANQRDDEIFMSHNAEEPVHTDAEDRIGVAEVVEDLTAIEGMINSYPTMTTDIRTQDSGFPGIHNSDPNLAADVYVPKPMYTSFTNPTISPNVSETEKLGSNYPKAHPIPVDKLGSVVDNYNFYRDPAGIEDDGKPVSRPPKDKLTSIAINVMQPNETTKTMIDNTNNESGSHKNYTNLVDSIKKREDVLHSHSPTNDSEENTERYFRRDPEKNTTNRPNMKETVTTPHFTWELVNSSTKGNDNSNKHSVDKYFNDTLQAIITKNDALLPNTTPKFASGLSLLKNITDIIHRFTSQIKLNLTQNPETRIDDSTPKYSQEFLENSSGSLTTAPPVITLMPAKSNLGINRPLRPRPKHPTKNENYREDVRSFSHIKNDATVFKTSDNVEAQNLTTSKDVPITELLDFFTESSYSTEITTPVIDIITSSYDMNESIHKDDFFLKNVTNTMVVSSSLVSSNMSNHPTQETSRLPKTNSEFETDNKTEEFIMQPEIYGNITKNIFEIGHPESSLEDSTIKAYESNISGYKDKLDSQNLGTGEKQSTAIPEGTYKISYHVSGSVTSKTSNRTKSLAAHNIPLNPDIVVEIPLNHTNHLSADQLRELANLATISDSLNNSYIQVENSPDQDVISHKAVSSSYTVNHAGFKILTKTYNKVPITKDDEKNFNKFYGESASNDDIKTVTSVNKDECNVTTSFRCDSGQCLPVTSKCNRLLDCPGGEDENSCSCADYLRSEFLLSKICDGVVDCWDFSDENSCDWCSPSQFVCANARQCIDQDRVCDGTLDCPLGDDERTCVTLADSFEDNDVVPYNEEGYLMVRKRGVWGRLCVQNFEKVITKAHSTLQLTDLGRAVCKAMTFEESDWVQETREPKELEEDDEERRYWEVWHNARPRAGETRLSFRMASCPRRRALRVRCSSLDCGLRPFVDTQQARIVGGTGASGGAWPWQAALYRDGDFQCGATLIAPDWLLSASHCFYQATEAHWVARLGALRRGAWPRGPWEASAPVTRVHLHPRYAPRGFRNDIALLRVPRLRTHARLRPACLPPPRSEPPPGTLCTVVGWGQLYELGRVFPDTLQEVELPVISTAECKRRTLFLPLYKVTDDMFCAGYERGGRDACLGDSGGPLMCQDADNRWYLHGVTSNGYGCARANRPGVYTKVANYIEWIDSVLQQYSEPEGDDGDSDLDAAENRSAAEDTCRGHRCPLGECLPPSSVCNGYLECSDGSDESHCASAT